MLLIGNGCNLKNKISEIFKMKVLKLEEIYFFIFNDLQISDMMSGDYMCVSKLKYRPNSGPTNDRTVDKCWKNRKRTKIDKARG